MYGYGDDQVRFALLSRGCLEFLNLYEEWTPDIILCTDWMTGYLPNFLKYDKKFYPRLKDVSTLFSIHNIYAQGPSRRYRFIPETERDSGQGPIPDFFGKNMSELNAMRRGIMYADAVNTVSKTYAKELMSAEYGEGLDGLLQERKDYLYGILNGIDYDAQDPSTDEHLEKKYSRSTLNDRILNKIALQRRFRLPESDKIFVISIVSRLSRQKGFDLLIPTIEPFLKMSRAQLIVVGVGDTELMDFFQNLEKKFPDNVRAHLQYDGELPRSVYAGSDIVLIPSKFEPCGLTQMEAMRYGAIPVARRVGGLADTIIDFDPAIENAGNGFLFDDFEAMAFFIAIVRSFVNWRHRPSWRKLQLRAMKADFSWEHSAKEYISLFQKMTAAKKSDSI